MTQSPDYLSDLNRGQRCAVEHFCGPLLVVAGAGSGKTRALTYRIAHLIRHHRVNPENILAVTFTNKAAREMKHRIERLFSQQVAAETYGKDLEDLSEQQQVRLRSRVYRTYLKDFWIGTFHSLFARVLRFDIEKYRDEKGQTWDRTFSIFDQSDTQKLVKTIVTQEMNLDDRKFDPRSVRYAISSAKNQGWSPREFEQEQPNYRGRVIAEVYGRYQSQLAANNALDFDDLILVPTQLFRQNEAVLDYWHRKFRHILVDEYQDTNRTQYDLIRLLATNGANPRSFKAWEHRSIFVVGDVDQSIYSFRNADFTILLDFQQDFGDGLPDEDTRTMVKLEENYRSTANILEAANHLIENNTERIDKVLRPTRGEGETIYCYRAEDERDEAEFVLQRIRLLTAQNPEFHWGHFAILYRTNVQSRAFEEALVRTDIRYRVLGGLRFYDRKEVKDVLAYLRAIANPADTISLERIINTPRRGIGKTTLDRLGQAALALNVPLWEILKDETAVKPLVGRSANTVIQFGQMIRHWRDQAQSQTATAIFRGIMEASGYIAALVDEGTDEAEERRCNVEEVYNAMAQFAEDNEDDSLVGFLANASLSSDLDDLGEGKEAVTLMTLHSAKGLEFPIVFVVGLEDGLFPYHRSLDDPRSLEEERRLFYVGITRSQEHLYLTHAAERRLWGSHEAAVPSQFLGELPSDLVVGNWIERRRQPQAATQRRSTCALAKPTPNTNVPWQVGDRLVHKSYGLGEVIMVFDQGVLAAKFPSIRGRKILNPQVDPLQRLD